MLIIGVSRLGPLPPLLEEDYEDEAYEELSPSSISPGSSRDKGSGAGAGPSSAMSSSRHGVSHTFHLYF